MGSQGARNFSFSTLKLCKPMVGQPFPLNFSFSKFDDKVIYPSTSSHFVTCLCAVTTKTTHYKTKIY